MTPTLRIFTPFWRVACSNVASVSSVTPPSAMCRWPLAWISALSNSAPIVCDGGSWPGPGGGPVSIFSGWAEKSMTGLLSLEPLTSTVRSVTVNSKPLPSPTTPTLAACARSA